MVVVEVEEPERREEHEDNIDPSACKRGKTEEKLAYDFIDDEDDLTVGGATCCNGVGGHARFEEGHGDDCRDEDEERGEEESDADVDDVCTLETHDSGEVLKDLD